MRHPALPLLTVLGVTLLTAAPALGGRKPAEAEPIDATVPKSPPRKAPLFEGSLPLDLGRLPQGLANASAQGCHACHVEPYEAWEGSAHARGVTPRLEEAARAAGTPACLSCHLPLAQQHALSVTYAGGDPASPVTAPNAGWSPTLQAEGVTCAACHVRDAAVVGPHPPGGAPHTTTWTSTMSEASMCASCHQLTWPGATTPFYDTFGEWTRSAWSKAGVTCQDCHMGPGAGAVRTGADHAFRADPGRAVSILVGLSSPVVVRGQAPVQVSLTLQNTGAGHAFPSGSPLTGIRVSAGLLLDGDDGFTGDTFTFDLGQTVGPSAPWPVTGDTRIPAGGERTWTFDVSLPYKAQPGRWSVAVRLERTTTGDVDGPVHVERRVPILVE